MRIFIQLLLTSISCYRIDQLCVFFCAYFRKILFVQAVRLISLTMKYFLCCLTFSSGNTPTFRTKLFNFQLEWDGRVRVSVRVKISTKETFWCDSCFPYKVYFLYIKDIWFALPKYVQIYLSQYTYEFARSASSAVAILQSKINSLVEFSPNIACLEKKTTIPGFRRTRKCKGLQKSLKAVDLYLPKLVDCRTTWFYFVWRRRRHHDDEIY